MRIEMTLARLLITTSCAVLLLLPNVASALLVAGPDIIAAPAFVIDNTPGATNRAQQAFDERQDVLLLGPLMTDAGVIGPGTVVDSHMIFLNTDGPIAASDSQVWTFDGLILGVMSDQGGLLEGASSAFLGAAGTIYPGPFALRGIEVPGDSYLVAGNSITVNMSVVEPGDWIRVVTAANPIPEPTSAVAFGVGVLVIGATLRKRSS